VLHFAVSGALLGGGAGVGCAGKDRPIGNTGYVEEPRPDDGMHANPGPTEDPGQPEAEDHVNTAPVASPEPDAPSAVHLNTQPGAEPAEPGSVIVNPVEQPEPESGTPTMNVVKQPEPTPTPTTKHVNVAKEPTGTSKGKATPGAAAGPQ
jgi:hypothetical protein